MHSEHPTPLRRGAMGTRLAGLMTATLALFTFVVVPAASIEDKQGGRRRGSMRNLSGNPPVQFPVFRLTVFDPDLFGETCIDPIDAANGTPGPICRELLGGIDHVAAGTGMRNAGYGTIRMRGGPSGAAQLASVLFWSVIADDTIAFENDGLFMDISFQGHRVTGERVGVIDELCWGSEGFSVHYSADVSRLVPDVINGDYQVTGVPSSVTDGHDPFQELEDPPLPWAQGASLISIYTHPDAGGRVYLHEGAALLIDSFDLTLDLLPPVPATGTTVVRHTRIGGDGQTHDGEPLSPFATFLGIELEAPTELQIRGPGSPVDPSPDWQGQDGAPMPGLWDTQSDELWATLLTAGAISYSLRWQALTDDPEPLPLTAPMATIPTKEEPVPPEPPGPPEPDDQFYDCVYVGAMVMTTTY